MSGAPQSRFYYKRWCFVLIVSLAFILKGLLATLSIWGLDFLYILRNIVTGQGSFISQTYWGYLNRLMYQLWIHLTGDGTDLTAWIMDPHTFPLSFDIYILVFLLKLPILILDVICGFLIYRITLTSWNKTTALRAFYFWILNPFVILTAEMNGTNDLFPIAFMLLATLFFVTRRRVLTGISLFAAITSKFYPLLLLPVLAIRTRKSWTLIILLVASVAGIVAYFYWVRVVLGAVFQLSLLEYSPMTYRISELLISPRTDLYIGLATVTAVIFAFLIYRFWDWKKANITDAILTFLLAYFAFANWWPQYLLLLIPFLIIKAAYERRWLFSLSLLLLIAFLISLTSFNLAGDMYLLFITNYYEWMHTSSTVISHFASHVVTRLVLNPILRSLYASLSIYYAAKLVVQNSPLLTQFISRRR
jgi:hypothetical protein